MDKQRFKLLLKCTVFHMAKLLGLFKLAIKLTENEYRILCYHSGSIHDEHLFWPNVFITSSVFEKHLQLIKKYQFNVLPLDVVVKKAIKHDIPKRCLVFTFDDGFYSTKKVMEPLLKEANYPATLYVTTYYVVHQRPIFNVALCYLFFKTELESFDLTFFNGDQYTFTTKGSKASVSIETIKDYAKTLDESHQNQLLKNIGVQLNINMEMLWADRIFHNINADELKTLHEHCVFDIQLHTHRHNWPNDEDTVTYEIQKNRKVLSEITGKPEEKLVHFCYPSGVWRKDDGLQLKKLGIMSATTLDPGLNNIETNLLSLARIVCSNNKPIIVFEAEITGFNALLMGNLNRLVNVFKRCF